VGTSDRNGVFAELISNGWLKQAKHFDEVDSTNTAARRFADETPGGFPALFIADLQTHGRGRGGHVWWSPRGCLMMTLAVTSRDLPEDRSTWSQLALLTGVSSAEAIEQVCPELDVQLKWPNDLYLAGRKVGGILIESFAIKNCNGTESRNIGSLSEQRHFVDTENVFAIGVGLNVSMNWHDAPAEVAARAICLSSAAGRPISIDDVLYEMVRSLSSRLDNWRSERAHWFDDWHSRCLLSGKIVTLEGAPNSDNQQRLTGRCEGIAKDGCLLLRTESGGILAVNVGEVVNWQSV
jgi:BirA family transcriptional regulator, biotin operon repressor / biotin---[acetyl-CoA-carboxylase] ligase